MREIKFRAWTGSKMEYNVMAGFLGAFYVKGIDEKDSACMSNFNTKYSEQTPIMEFTGLLDKNSKEIYEGDIVRFFNEKETVREVSWNNEIGFTLGTGSIGLYYKELEVIGNVFENSDLLTIHKA